MGYQVYFLIWDQQNEPIEKNIGKANGREVSVNWRYDETKKKFIFNAGTIFLVDVMIHDFRHDADSTILVQERAKGSKLEPAFKQTRRRHCECLSIQSRYYQMGPQHLKYCRNAILQKCWMNSLEISQPIRRYQLVDASLFGWEFRNVYHFGFGTSAAFAVTTTIMKLERNNRETKNRIEWPKNKLTTRWNQLMKILKQKRARIK